MNPRVKSVKCLNEYILFIEFDNNETKVFDLEPYLEYPVYQKLKNESLWKKAFVSNGTIVWDDETDMDPDTLYLEGISKALQASIE